VLKEAPEDHIGRPAFEFELQLESHLAPCVTQLLERPATRHVSKRTADQCDAQRLVLTKHIASPEALADTPTVQLQRGLDKVVTANMNLGIVAPGQE